MILNRRRPKVMSDCNHMNSCNQEQDQMKQVQQISFLLVDLNLTLTTTPIVGRPQKISIFLVEAVDELRKYNAAYGPIMNFGGTAKSTTVMAVGG